MWQYTTQILSSRTYLVSSHIGRSCLSMCPRRMRCCTTSHTPAGKSRTTCETPSGWLVGRFALWACGAALSALARGWLPCLGVPSVALNNVHVLVLTCGDVRAFVQVKVKGIHRYIPPCVLWDHCPTACPVHDESICAWPAACRWATWTCVLGFDVMGIWPPDSDGTDVNALDRSPSGRYLASADDLGKVRHSRFHSVTVVTACTALFFACCGLTRVQGTGSGSTRSMKIQICLPAPNRPSHLSHSRSTSSTTRWLYSTPQRTATPVTPHT